MTHRLSRLFTPRHIAVIGGGIWCENLIHQLRAFGFKGKVSVVHPSRANIAGLATMPTLADVSDPPDAAFLGVNRHLTIEMVDSLARMGAGGAICFASGFREASGELADGDDLQHQLIRAAGQMPILGPNCYGLINALDGVVLWPDQHGLRPVARGVAILTQSSNLAITLTMQQRALPIACMVTTGNQAVVSLPDIAQMLLDDPRITALGLHIEGVSDLSGLEALAQRARACGKSIVAIKVGASEQARHATLSHTASLAGSDAGAEALFRRLGIVRVDTAAQFLETLKLLHLGGTMQAPTLAMASCSGGEASLVADACLRAGVLCPPLSASQKQQLRAVLGPRVALANPLDYHTYIWGDVPRMADTFAALADGPQTLTGIIVDFPREDCCDPADWACVTEAAQIAARRTGRKIALVSTLPEGLSERVATQILAAGLIPLAGLEDALFALAAAARVAMSPPVDTEVLPPRPPAQPTALTEAEAKVHLAAFGVAVPKSIRAVSEATLRAALADMPTPLVVKAEGLAHKSDQGGVLLVPEYSENTVTAAQAMPTQSWLVEEMICDAVAELLIGVTCDPAHGYVLTLGAGGVLTELHQDTISLLIPAARDEVDAALENLRLAPLLNGYRNRPAADRAALLDTIMGVQDFVIAHHGAIAELEINPLICTATRAVAVDALLTMEDPT